MATPRTVLTYPLTGASKDFNIPFEYLARKFVVITLIGKTRRVLVLNSDYRFATRKVISTTLAWGPAEGFDLIEIRRVTSATERLVDFSDGSILRAYDLNTSQVQSLHIAEEARDLTADTIGVNNSGDLDARGRKIVNVADGVLDGDAVNLRQQKAWAGSAMSQAERAKTEADRAGANSAQSADSARFASQSAWDASNQRQSSENAATVSRNWSQASAQSSTDSQKAAQGAEASNNQAGRKATEAVESARQASASQVSAFNDANFAKTHAEQAKKASDQSVAAMATYGSYPLGSLAMFARDGQPPGGFLWCNGATFSASQYPELAAYLGTNVLPDFRDRYPRGAGYVSAGAYTGWDLPAHQHVVPQHGHSATSAEAGHHGHEGSTGYTDMAGSHQHPVETVNSGGSKGNSGYAATAGDANSPHYQAITGAAGEHRHNLVLNIAGAGGHVHGITVNDAGQMTTSGGPTGSKVEVNAVAVHFFIKATSAPANADIASLISRIQALEAKSK